MKHFFPIMRTDKILFFTQHIKYDLACVILCYSMRNERTLQH